MQIGVRLEREVWGVVLENSAGVYFLWQSWDSEFKSLNVEYQFGWGAPLLFAVGLTGVARARSYGVFQSVLEWMSLPNPHRRLTKRQSQ